MLRLSILTLIGLMASFLTFGGELSSDEKAELNALRAQRTSVVTMITAPFDDASRRAPTYVATLAHLKEDTVKTPNITTTKLASSTPVALDAADQFVATTTVADPAKLAALIKTQADKNTQDEEVLLSKVTANRVNVRSGPSTSNAVLGQVVRAEVVRVVARANNDWVKIVVEGDGIEGYMSAQFLTPVS